MLEARRAEGGAVSDEQMNEMAEAFLRWSLPEDVCADAIACTPRAPHRTGTNLLTARQAVEMIKFVCGPELAVMHAEARDAKARIAELEAELERVKRAAINGMNAATAHGHGLVEQAARLRAESNPDALESERAMNAALTEQLERAELARQDALAELAAALADAERYRELRRLTTTWPTTVLVVNYNIGHTWHTADAPDEIDGVLDDAIAARGAT